MSLSVYKLKSENNRTVKRVSLKKVVGNKNYRIEDLDLVYFDNNYVGKRQKTVHLKLDSNFTYLLIPSLFEKNSQCRFLIRAFF
jgi:hypothetical protein